MLPIFTAEEMAELDRIVIEDLGIPGMVLMETAARGVFRTAVEMLSQNYGPSVPLPMSLTEHDHDEHHHENNLPPRFVVPGRFIKVYCGKGNNGGDGLAVARMLDSLDADVQVILMCNGDDLTGDAKTNYDLAMKLQIPIIENPAVDDLDVEPECDLVIDALLGTGIKGAAKGIIAEAIEAINEADCPVLSIDIPSGVEGSTGDAPGQAVMAHETATMAALKRGLCFSPGRELAGEVSVVDIGSPSSIIEGFDPYLWRVEPDDIYERLPGRPMDTHKGECGRVFIVAGSPGLTGAACMSAEAAVKSGAGLVVLGIPKSLNAIVEVKLTEAMSLPLPENNSGGFSADADKDIREKLQWATGCAVGPGIGRAPETLKYIRKLIAGLDKPVVIDADGLFALAESPDSLNNLPEKSILTPHIGEFANLLNIDIEEVKRSKVEIAREKAQEWNTVIVLKGSPTIVAAPDGNLYMNTTGNPGMATGGVGDVLTGVLTALLAMGLEPVDAAIAGTFIHGLAGDMAAAEKGIFGMTATDLMHKLPEAFREFGC